MNVADALDELRVGILRDMSTLKSGPTPDDHYWSDERLVRYIDDAHKRFARMALCIHDDTTQKVTQVVLRDTVSMYALHPSVRMVLSVRHQDDSQDMVRINHQDAVNQNNDFTEDFQFAIVTNPGKPTRYSTDEGMDPARNHAIRLRLLGVPDATQVGKVVYLRVIRQPLADITTKDTDKTGFEIPEEYQLDMLEWAAYRCLRNWDIDGEDRAKAEAHKKRFEDAVAECKRDVLRKTWNPPRWKFGGNGFTYVHN